MVIGMDAWMIAAPHLGFSPFEVGDDLLETQRGEALVAGAAQRSRCLGKAPMMPGLACKPCAKCGSGISLHSYSR
jgi:hypothetical protein